MLRDIVAALSFGLHCKHHIREGFIFCFWERDRIRDLILDGLHLYSYSLIVSVATYIIDN